MTGQERLLSLLEYLPDDMLMEDGDICFPDGYEECWYNADVEAMTNQSVIPPVSFVSAETTAMAGFAGTEIFWLKFSWSEGGKLLDRSLRITARPSDGSLNRVTGTFHNTEIYGAALEDDLAAIGKEGSILHLYLNFYTGGMRYTITGQNLSYEEMENITVWMIEEGIQKDCFVPENGVQKEEWYTNPGYENCLSDESFGAYAPSYIPDDTDFLRAIRSFSRLDTLGGWFRDELFIEYDGAEEYTIVLTWSDSWGKNGWAGPMLDVSELSIEAIKEMERERSRGTWLVFGAYFGNVMIYMDSYTLSPEEAYAIMTSGEQDPHQVE